MPSVLQLALALLLAAATSASAQTGAVTWTAGGPLQVTVDPDVGAGRFLTVTAGDSVLAVVRSLDFDFHAPLAAEIVANTPERLAIRLTYPALVDWREGAGPKTTTLEVTAVDGGLRFQTDASAWAEHVGIRLDDRGDHIYGVIERLGRDLDKSPDLRGQAVSVEVEGLKELYPENHANLWSPFFVSTAGYGSYVQTFAAGEYVIGRDGEHALHHETGVLDWYLFNGPGGAAIHRSYFAVIGRPKRVPMWALGPTIWRDEHAGGAPQVLSDLAGFTERRVPLTATWVDRPYSDGKQGWTEMNFSDAFNGPFASPDEWIGQAERDYGVHVMSWAAPLTFDAGGDFPGTFGGTYDYLDLTDPAAVAELARRLRERQYAHGIRGHKLDRGDEQFPSESRWLDWQPEPVRRNLYVYLYAKTFDEIIREAWGDDQFTFARAGWSGVQPYLSAVWGGDPRTSWDGMAGNLANAIRAGYMGFPVWGTDAGGYLGERRPSGDLFSRWVAWGAWNGMFEMKLDGVNGDGADRLPWNLGEGVVPAVRAAAETRMRMLPTLYSLANTSATTGVMMQPMQYAFPADQNTWGMWDQHLLGDIFVVAPVLEPDATTRRVYLPAGEWRPVDDPATVYQGGQTVTVPAPFGTCPVLVRSNRAYVTGNVLAGNQATWQSGFAADRALTVHAVPGLDGEAYTFTYVDADDGDAEKPVRVSREGRTVRVTAPALGLGGEVEVRLGTEPQRVTANGRAVRVDYDADQQAIRVPFRAGEPVEVVVEVR